ncbi:exocyst complex component 3-like protein 4 [Sparus aurata]|uniref:exocyst complex component 3-like protein 4 n=1 Tax=Sparus aurata TaxID=8175 RepID=UPI0011C1C838|nr:exocyst complex component 3-like protein 4 [Sparus aurata]
MRKLLNIRKRSKSWGTDSRKPLIENNNNDIQDGCSGYDNPLDQNTCTTQVEKEIPLQELAELLGVTPDVNPSEDGSCCSLRPETNSPQQKQRAVRLIQASVSQHLPKPPSDLDQNLQQHLVNVQETVPNELMRLWPLLEKMDLTESLIDCYHRQTLGHIDELLKNAQSCKKAFVLMNWVLNTYLSQELLGHPDLQKMDPMKKVDLLLFTELAVKAKNKLLDNVQKQVRAHLENILQIERRQDVGDKEETCIGLYINTIMCINAMPKEAQEISSKLSDEVREVCFQELLIFLERYSSEQTEILGKKAKMDKPETIHFFKTLKTCKELKQHVQTNSKGINESLIQEIAETLEKMEDFTLKLLMDIVDDMAEIHLSNYFKTENKQFFFLILGLKAYFPKLSWCQDVQKRVMDEAYKLIAHIYLKHLVQSSQKKLKKCWSADVGQTVTEDAQSLHDTISGLAPDVKQWNLMMLKVTELLEDKDSVAVKLTAASMLKECPTWSEDEELLPALLRWKGLSGWEVKEVLEVLDSLSEHKPSSRSVSWYSCLTCW